MSIEKKTIRSDIPGSHVYLNGNVGYIGATLDDSRRLVIPGDITLSGDIRSCSYLLVEGVVQADRFTGRRLDVLETGLFNGTAEVQDCVIAGRLEGKLFVHGRLTVKATGRICGDVQYNALEVEAGAKIEGPLTSVTQEAQDAAPVPVLAVLPPVQGNVAPLFSSEDDDDDGSVTGRPSAYRRATRI